MPASGSDLVLVRIIALMAKDYDYYRQGKQAGSRCLTPHRSSKILLTVRPKYFRVSLYLNSGGLMKYYFIYRFGEDR